MMQTYCRTLCIIALSCVQFMTPARGQQTDSIGIGSGQVPRFSYRQLYPPTGLMLAGLLLNGKSPHSLNTKIVNYRNEHSPHFHTKWDNYLQFSPIVFTYGFEAIGMHPKTDILNRSVILLKSELLMTVTVRVLKNATHVLRPDSSAYNSFPSGHTAQAFAAAALLSEEYGYRYKWVPYFSYGLASTVGILRIANNKHYLSDVLVAAGIGILSTKAAYWTHQYKWGHKNRHPHTAML